jgi:NAD(P)-dependent dehydrogenase (short-subunit alcohol dehydrogenase family)
MKLTQPEFRDLSPRDLPGRGEGANTLGREQTPEDIGKLVCFLASDDAMNITGQRSRSTAGSR